MRKRLKVSMACDTCRSRKVKCNGARPVCDVCNKRKDSSVMCSYGSERGEWVPNQRPGVGSLGRENSSDVQVPQPSTLDSPPQTAEALASHANGAAAQQLSPRCFMTNTEYPLMPGSCDARSVSLRREGSKEHSWSSPTSFPSLRNDHQEVADSMTGVVGELSKSREFFGSSSAGSFMRHMQHAIDSKMGVTSRSSDSDMAGISLSERPVAKTTLPRQPAIEYVLPPRKIANELVDAYWELVYPLYPFVDRNSFTTGYESIWTGANTMADECILLSTMNVIFALGVQVSDIVRPEERRDRAQIYFKRAENLRSDGPWDDGTVESVSCLLLMGIYLQSANIPQRCWMVVGHAIRIAQSLGLHLPERNTLRSRREKEVSRRIWHGCILMDRVLAMTFGRPAMIPKWLSAVVPLPKMIDDEFLDVQVEGSFERPDNKSCLMVFFVSQLKLHDIMDDILLELYMVQDGHKTHADVVTVFKLDEKLTEWTRGLSDELKLDAPVGHLDSLRKRLAVVNHTRFLHARMLLLRPILALYCLPINPATSVDSLSSRMTIQCSSLCLQTAHHSIELIYSHLDLTTVFGPVPAWWYSVLYVYTAATILLAERIRPEIGLNVDGYSNIVSWGRAIQILKAYARIANSAKRCVAALEILSAKIPRAAQFSESLDADPTHTTPVFQFDDHETFTGIDLDGIFLDSNDMEWLHSVPGSLQTGM